MISCVGGAGAVSFSLAGRMANEERFDLLMNGWRALILSEFGCPSRERCGHSRESRFGFELLHGKKLSLNF